MLEFSFKKDPMVMGAYDEQYGQTFWAEVYESDMPVMFNLKQRNLTSYDTIAAEESVNKRSAKGKDYLRLRKVQVKAKSSPDEPVQGPQARPGPAPQPTNNSQLDRIEKQLSVIQEQLGQLLAPDSAIDSGDH